MSTIVRKVSDKYFEINLNNLYKTRQDNNLTVDQLVSKYTGRILDGTLNGTRELEGWEVSFAKALTVAQEINEQIDEINDTLRQIR